MAHDLTRRDVLAGTAATMATLALAKTGVAAEAAPRRPDRLRIGVIGCGGKGWSGMEDAANFGDIVAICDTDANERSRGMLQHPRATTFADYREMVAAMRGKMDAVVISTPDHHHYLASLLALRAGLHVYCEKPLTRTIWEARQLARVAREKRVATQMGNQSTASLGMRKAAAHLKARTYGIVKEVHLWTDRAGGYWRQGHDRPNPTPTPRTLDFDLWVGPSPERPYAPGYHPFAWRGYWDFGTGSLGDMGCHIFNMPFMGLDLRDPLAVQAETSGHNRDSFPTWVKVKYEFGERKGRPALNVHWYDGGKKPPAELVPGVTLGGNGVIVICEKGTIYSLDESNSQFFLLGGGPLPEIDAEASPGHMAEFARAALGGPAAVSNFPDYAGPLTETVLLGNLAIWANGPRLEWDARRMRVKNAPEYDALIRPTYRQGWSG